jgi:hypothetical protein
MRLSHPQLHALRECSAAGELFQDPHNGWRWLRKLPTGMIYKVAANPTICVLIELGLMARLPGRKVVTTDEGELALPPQERQP